MSASVGNVGRPNTVSRLGLTKNDSTSRSAMAATVCEATVFSLIPTIATDSGRSRRRSDGRAGGSPLDH